MAKSVIPFASSIYSSFDFFDHNHQNLSFYTKTTIDYRNSRLLSSPTRSLALEEQIERPRLSAELIDQTQGQREKEKAMT